MREGSGGLGGFPDEEPHDRWTDAAEEHRRCYDFLLIVAADPVYQEIQHSVPRPRCSHLAHDCFLCELMSECCGTELQLAFAGSRISFIRL